MMRALTSLLSAALLVPTLVAAQTPGLAGGVPTTPATGTSLSISLSDAVARGLKQNLAVILEEQQTRTAGSARLRALSELVPHVSGSVRQSRQVVNLAAFGFTGFGDFEIPSLVGPFGVFDARIALTTPIVDVAGWQSLKAATSRETAARADYRQTRETVVLAVGNLYLITVADQARVDAAGAEIATAEALGRLAEDRYAAGLIARIDVVREQVQLQRARAQRITAETALETHKLQLARAIGLPAGQPFALTTRSTFLSAPVPTADAAVQEAMAHRPDMVSARALVDAARAARRAAVTGALPSLHVDADVGAIGPSASAAERTFAVAASVRVPLFAGGQRRAEVQRADAELKQREAELADLDNGLRYDVEAALLAVRQAEAGVSLATSTVDLTRDALAQAQDRFQAGVASSVELVQAQESVTRATEQYIASVYAHTIAKAGLARAMGDVEQRFLSLVGGE